MANDNVVNANPTETAADRQFGRQDMPIGIILIGLPAILLSFCGAGVLAVSPVAARLFSNPTDQAVITAAGGTGLGIAGLAALALGAGAARRPERERQSTSPIPKSLE